MTTLVHKAGDVLIALSHSTSRIEIAGSIRRGVESPGDIEIVAIPIYEHSVSLDPQQTDMFSGILPFPVTVNLLDQELERLYASSSWEQQMGGPRYRKLMDEEGAKLDLFITDPRRWGIIFTVRTGPADFSHGLARWALRKGYHIHDGLLHGHPRPVKNHKRVDCELGELCPHIIPTPEEVDVFKALGLHFIQPHMRAVFRFAAR